MEGRPQVFDVLNELEDATSQLNEEQFEWVVHRMLMDVPCMFPEDLGVHECARFYADENKLPFSRMNHDVFERLFNVRSIQDALSSDALNDDGKRALLDTFEKTKQNNEIRHLVTQNINGVLVNPTPEWIKENRKSVKIPHYSTTASGRVKIGDHAFSDPSVANRGVSFSVSAKGRVMLDVDMAKLGPDDEFEAMCSMCMGLIENAVAVEKAEKQERREYKQVLASDDTPREEGRRHPGVPSHIGRLSPPLADGKAQPEMPESVKLFGGEVPPIQNWSVGLKVLGMNILAMTLLGGQYGDEGCVKRIQYQEDMFKEVCGDPSKRTKLHPAFASMNDGDAYLMTIAANARSLDLSKDPLWPHVWRKVWDRLFEIQDEARQEALDSAKASREDMAKARLQKKLLRRKEALAHKDPVASSVYGQEYAERVRVHDEREANEREEAKAAEELRRAHIAKDRERRSNAQAPSAPLPPPLRPHKKKTAVAVSGVEASKRETDKAESLDRLRISEANRRKKEAEMASEAAEREQKVNIGFSIQYGS